MNRSIAKRQILLKKYPLYFIKFYFRENVKEEIRENFRKHFRCSKIVASENDCESLDSLFEKRSSRYRCDDKFHYCLSRTHPISSPRQPHSGIITQDAKRYLGRCLSLLIHGSEQMRSRCRVNACHLLGDGATFGELATPVSMITVVPR